MSESVRVKLMYALELLAERAVARGDLYALAVVDEAAAIHGWAPGAIMDMLYTLSREERYGLLERARRGRRRALLRAKAKGLLHALTELAEADVLDGRDCAEVRRLMWLATQPPEMQPQ